MLTLRSATADDALPLLDWQRHVETRRYARDPTVASETEHLAWFARKLESPDCLFFVATDGDNRVASLRLDRLGEEWELSIVVAPELRGRGIGKQVLRLLMAHAPGPLVAEVLPGNEPSHRLFDVCGWQLGEDGRYRYYCLPKKTT
jgi:RimJ/RimL family protein N-acetyltransferase